MKDYVHFGNHTRNHPIVTKLSDDELEDEILNAKGELKYLYQLDHFAYPNGDYSDREVDYLRENNFISARTTDTGYITDECDLMRLKISRINDTAHLNKFRVQLSCLSGWIRSVAGKKNLAKKTSEKSELSYR